MRCRNDEDQHEFNLDMTRKKRNRLQIQTIHDSKGLEYQVVFICSLNYSFPYFDIKNYYSSQERLINNHNKLPICKFEEA